MQDLVERLHKREAELREEAEDEENEFVCGYKNGQADAFAESAGIIELWLLPEVSA